MATNPQPRPTVIDLARAIRAEYPGQFDDIPDYELGASVKQEYPDHFNDFDDAPAQSPAMRGAGRIPTPQEVSRQIPLDEPPHPDELFGQQPAPQQRAQAAPPIPTMFEAEMGANRPGSLEALRQAATISPAALLPEAPETGKAQRPPTLMEAEMGATMSPEGEQAGQEVFRSVAAMLNPTTAASMLALGGADKVIQAAAAHPRVMAVLQNAPTAKAVLQKLGQLLVPGTVAGGAGYEAVTLGQQAMEAYDRGDTAEGSRLFGQAVAAGLVAAGAGAAGVSRMSGRAPESATAGAAGPSEPTPPRPKLLDEIIRGMEGGKAPEGPAPKMPAPGQPKVTPQPKVTETTGPRTQGELVPTRRSEIVRELEPPAERSPLEQVMEATEARASIPRPPGESQITTGDTTRVSMGPMSESNRGALAERLAGRAEVSKGDDGRTLIDFDAFVDPDTATIAVNEALSGADREEPPPSPEEVLPDVAPEEGVAAGGQFPAPADLLGVEPVSMERAPEPGITGEMERDQTPTPSDLFAGLEPAREPEPAALTPDELVRAGEAEAGGVDAGRRGAGEGDVLDIVAEPVGEPPLPGFEQEKVPETVSGKARKAAYDMTADEIDAAIAQESKSEQDIEVELFGEEGAKRYRALQRKANSIMLPPPDTEAAYAEVERMEGALTEQQRNRLYGIGEGGPSLDELRDYQRAMGGLDYESPQALGESLRFAITKVGTESDPAKMRPQEQVAYATLRHAFEQAQDLGFDTGEVSRAAVNAAAARFSDPEDARLILQRFIKEPPAAKPQPKALPETVSGRRPAGVPAFAKPGDQGFRVALDDITVDPQRFQFKEEARRLGGVTAKLKDVEKWDPAAEKTILVWQDPANAKLYVVDGHHRLDLARRLGVRDIQPHFLTPDEAKTAEEARAIGALRNMREGTAAAIDAAKFMRDTGYDAADLKRFGVSATSGTTEKAEALRRLTPPIFGEITLGRIPEDYGVAAGRASEEPAVQKKIIEVITGREQRTGSRVPQSMAESIADRVAHAGTRTTSEQTLFGTDEKTESLFEQEAEIVDYVRGRLSREKRLFKTVAEGSSQLAEAGNVLVDEKNREISVGAAQAGELFDRLSKRSGTVNEIIQEAAQSLASGEKAADVKERTYEQIRAAIQEAIPGGGESRKEGAGEAGEDQPAPEGKVTGQQTLYSGLAGFPEMLRTATSVTTKDIDKLISFAKGRGLIEAAKGGGDMIGGILSSTGEKLAGSEKGDLGAWVRKWHTPRFIAERHPQFMPLFERAVRFDHERHSFAEELYRAMEPYFGLRDAKLRKKLDNRLIHARYKRSEDLDWSGFTDEQKQAAEPAFQAVRKAMHRAFEEMQNLAVDLASDGRVTDASQIKSLTDAKRLAEETGLPAELATKQAERLWDILEELRKTAVQGYVPFTRFGNWRFGFEDTRDPRGSVWEHRTNTVSAHVRWAKFKKTHAKKLNNPRYHFRGPHEITKDLPLKGIMEGLGGFEFAILMQLAKLEPDYQAVDSGERMKRLQAILESSGMTPEQSQAAVEAADKAGVIEAKKGGASFTEQVRLLQTHIKKAGFRAHFTHAKEVRGFEGNLERPFADYIMGLSNHLAKRRFIRDAEKLTEKIPRHKGRLKQYAQQYVEYLASPPEEWGWIRGMMFHAYLGNALGPNIRSPLVNMTQIPMMAYPWLAQYGSDAQVAKELTRAYKDVALTVGPPGPEGRRVLVDFDKLPEDVRTDAKQSIADGTLRSQMMDELGGLARARSKTSKLLNKGSGAFFAAAEEVNRVVAFVAAHRLYQANIGASKKPARQQGTGQRHGIFLSEFGTPLAFAEDVVNKTQLEYGRYNRPELFRGRKSVLFVFKSFMVGNLELQQRLWNSWVDANETALTGGQSGGKKPPRTPGGPPQPPPGHAGGGEGGGGPRLPGEPFDPISPAGPKPKAWWKKTGWARMLFIQFMASGVKGLWYMGEFMAAASIAWKIAHHGEELDLETTTRDWLHEIAGDRIGDAIFYGSPQAIEGMPDLHGSLSMGEPIGIGGRGISDVVPVFALPQRVGEAFLELFEGEGWADGFRKALVRFGGSGALPATLKAMEAQDKGIRDRGGRKLALPGGRESLTPFELIEMGAGFTPTAVSKARRQERSINLADTAKAGPKAYFLSRLANAYEAQDEKLFDKIVGTEIPAWNSDRRVFIGSPREGTYREVNVDMRERRNIPKAWRDSVDISWDDIERVVTERQRPAENRQMRGVRRSVRPYVEELQQGYADVPMPEELLETVP